MKRGQSHTSGDANAVIANISPVLSKKFMDWLNKSGKLNEVIDLIRIDGDVVKSYLQSAGKKK